MSEHSNNPLVSSARRAEDPPRWGGIRLGPTLAGVLYGLLLGAAGLSFFGRQFPGAFPALGKLTPWIFLAFLSVFAFYRLGLVKAGKYSAFKAFFQIGLGLVVFFMLMPGQAFKNPPEDSLSALLQDSNPRVRSLAAELAGYRPEGAAAAPLLVRALGDEDEVVRRYAHASLVKLAGADLGAPEDPKAVEAWKARFP